MPVVHSLVKHSYKLVEDKNDGLGKVPAYEQEAFQLGITFKAKYVGTLEITRPTCRAEIVTAMRKVRYEFKIKGIEKRRVNLTISVDGIKVAVRKRRRRMRKERHLDEEPVVLHEHQIGRIFYVSHDSMDLKIFSYITKDNFDNQFRCSVFKAYRKSKALFVVRTIGQAFEVCHRLQHDTGEKKETDQKEQTPKVDPAVLADSGTDIDAVDQEKTSPNDNQKETLVYNVDQRVNVKPMHSLMEINKLLCPVDAEGKPEPLTLEQLRLLFTQQLEHLMQETEAFKAENQLLKDQLMLERNARSDAQERERSLLQKNRELLQTIQALSMRLHMNNPDETSLVWNTSFLDPNLTSAHPAMYSTPRKNDYLIDLMANDSTAVVIPSSQAGSNRDAGTPRVAPLASVETSNLLQGLNSWKTFDDEDHGASPGNDATDESTSDSSDEDDAFSDSFTRATLQAESPPKNTNACNEAKLINGSATPLSSGATTANSHSKNNGAVLYNSLEMTENNNFDKAAEVRPTIQTDF